MSLLFRESFVFAVLMFCLDFAGISGLNNGLVLTPPMGWLAWERFRCNIDCETDPENCISENLFMGMAKRLAEDGFKELGYQYIIIDDCWMTTERDSSGRLQADPVRFSHGIKYIADYVHSLGLKLGIYQDIGTKTCIGYPGSQGSEKIDVDTFAEWEVDYFKLDGCFMDPTEFDTAYPMVGNYINKTGRKMVYSCSWPAYQVEKKMSVNWTGIRENCNLWRNYGDIQDSYESITDIILWYAANQDILTAIAGPGAWNDPDMLIIGNYGLSLGQSESQMAFWAIFAAPLMMSNDLRDLRPEFKAILQNREVIAVNQDALGIQGRQLLTAMQGHGVEVWRRPILPVAQFENQTWASFAVVCWNRRVDGIPFPFFKALGFYGLTHPGGYYIKDLFSKKDYGLMKASDMLNFRVNPAGGVIMFKATLAIATDERNEIHKDLGEKILQDRIKLAKKVVSGQKFINIPRRSRISDHRISSASPGDPILIAFKVAAVIVLLIVLRFIGIRWGLSGVVRGLRRSFKKLPGRKLFTRSWTSHKI